MGRQHCSPAWDKRHQRPAHDTQLGPLGIPRRASQLRVARQPHSQPTGKTEPDHRGRRRTGSGVAGPIQTPCLRLAMRRSGVSNPRGGFIIRPSQRHLSVQAHPIEGSTRRALRPCAELECGKAVRPTGVEPLRRTVRALASTSARGVDTRPWRVARSFCRSSGQCRARDLSGS
jgi:hypothetical protein